MDWHLPRWLGNKNFDSYYITARLHGKYYKNIYTRKQCKQFKDVENMINCSALWDNLMLL